MMLRHGKLEDGMLEFSAPVQPRQWRSSRALPDFSFIIESQAEHLWAPSRRVLEFRGAGLP
jgi:hypothetical protein